MSCPHGDSSNGSRVKVASGHRSRYAYTANGTRSKTVRWCCSVRTCSVGTKHDAAARVATEN